MRHIDLMFQTMLAELADRTFDAQFASDFDMKGRFVSVPVKGRDYWYFDTPTADGVKRRYVGPASDSEITDRVTTHRELKNIAKNRRQLVSTLTRQAGMVAPDRMTGDVTEALAKAGLFRLRAVLIGTVAFQCYSGILGLRLPSAAMQTGDADYAQDFAISAEVGDSLPPVLELLQSVDPTFRAVPHQADKARMTVFQNATEYRVEFLTSNRGSDDFTGKPSPMPALGGASAENLLYLDFLIYDAVRTVMLHRSGVSVVVPAPERYAVHKLIVVSQRRDDASGTLKSAKDALQASILCQGLLETRRGEDLKDAYEEAWNRGPSWQEALLSGIGMMTRSGMKALGECIGVGIGNSELAKAFGQALK